MNTDINHKKILNYEEVKTLTTDKLNKNISEGFLGSRTQQVGGIRSNVRPPTQKAENVGYVRQRRDNNCFIHLPIFNFPPRVSSFNHTRNGRMCPVFKIED
ncbi:hypothetical protein ABEB36_007426 [Hypothenemus hampei]|uniref:Uncharacterized protein n=1 Tax=Hypothenemus hampei TaxID=57062 RepID=A0ABD1ETZ1_HYPHA